MPEATHVQTDDDGPDGAGSGRGPGRQPGPSPVHDVAEGTLRRDREL